MAQTFFRTPFATSGDTTAVPNDVQPDGSVSYTEGFGPDYQAATDDPDVLYPERPIINDLFKVITQALQILQVHGFPDFITTAANGGSPYSYDQNSCVRYTDGVVYYSLVNSNTALPTDATKWTPLFPVASFKTGMMIIWEDITLPDSTWLWANGTTIGDGSSGATGRANADTSALFSQIWNAFPNSVRPIQTSSGSASTRGVSAAADFAAHKRLPVRDMRDVVPAGTGTMGGIADRGLLTAANTFGVDGTIFGATGGEQQHTPTIGEMVGHTHSGSGFSVDVGSHKHYIAAYSSVMQGNAPDTLVDGASAATAWGVTTQIGSSGTKVLNKQTQGTIQAPNVGLSGDVISASPSVISGSTDSTGGGNPFNVVQPTTICNYIVKL